MLPPAPAEDGRNIFVANCIGCHGKQADANTPAGKAWRVPDLHSPAVQQKTDAQLLQIVREGKGKMPPWGGILSPIDLEHVLAYVRSLKHH
jgi:mono/diheme cytochrome c family protein